jgi:hypothetical protein
MIWGAIGVDYKSGCFFYSGWIDSDEYQTILCKFQLIEVMNQRFGQHAWYFMTDGATSHTSRSTLKWLRSSCLVLPRWPPNTPDLKPIEWFGDYEMAHENGGTED